MFVDRGPLDPTARHLAQSLARHPEIGGLGKALKKHRATKSSPTSSTRPKSTFKVHNASVRNLQAQQLRRRHHRHKGNVPSASLQPSPGPTASSETSSEESSSHRGLSPAAVAVISAGGQVEDAPITEGRVSAAPLSAGVQARLAQRDRQERMPTVVKMIVKLWRSIFPPRSSLSPELMTIKDDVDQLIDGKLQELDLSTYSDKDKKALKKEVANASYQAVERNLREKARAGTGELDDQDKKAALDFLERRPLERLSGISDELRNNLFISKFLDKFQKATRSGNIEDVRKLSAILNNIDDRAKPDLIDQLGFGSLQKLKNAIKELYKPKLQELKETEEKIISQYEGIREEMEEGEADPDEVKELRDSISDYMQTCLQSDYGRMHRTSSEGTFSRISDYATEMDIDLDK